MSVAAYFDRTQMVTRRDEYHLSFHEFTVWSEPIAELITRALVDDLSTRFGDDQVMATPPSRGSDADWRIETDVTRFDVDEAGNTLLDARWTLLGRDDRVVARRRERITTVAAKPTDAASRVTALRQTIATLAERIGAAVPERGARAAR